MRWLLSFLLIFLYPLPGQTAFEFLDTGARPVAMGGAFCAVADDAHTLHYNPAGAGQLQGRKVALSSCRLFGLADLSLHNLCLLQPTRWGVLGLEIQRFGGILYSETALSLSYARPLRENLLLGSSLRGLQLAISGYGSDHTLVLDLGLLATVAPRVSWGVSMHNLNNGRLGRWRQEMPQVLSMGFAYCPNSRLLLSVDLRQDIANCSVDKLTDGGYPVELRLGQESHIWAPLTARLGLGTGPTRFSAGVGVRAGPFQLHYAYRSHQLLGGSHHVSLTWP